MNTSSLTKAIQEADRDGVLVAPEGLTGFSGHKLIGTLQRFAKLQSAEGCYLEVGVYQGLTLISTALATSARAIGIDNFSHFDPHRQNRTIIEQRRALHGTTNVELVDRDYEDALEDLSTVLGGDRVSLYFVDGPHDYRSQLVCLEAIKPYLSPRAVIVIDDSNYRHVRLANRDFLVFNPEYRLLFEAYTRTHPMNMTHIERDSASRGWWNGVNIIVRGCEHELETIIPSVPRSRTIQENEHLIQASLSSFVAPELVALFSAVMRAKPLRSIRGLQNLARAWRRMPPEFHGTSQGGNTWSDALPAFALNPALNNRSEITSRLDETFDGVPAHQ